MLLTAILVAGHRARRQPARGCWSASTGTVSRRSSELREVNDDLSFYSRVLRATDSALAATDERGQVLWVNEAFERATGWTLEVVRGQHAMDVLRGPGTDPETLQLLDEAMDRRRAPSRSSSSCTAPTAGRPGSAWTPHRCSTPTGSSRATSRC